MADYNFLLETRLSQDQQAMLQILQGVCRAAGLNLYLTGGPMRDLLTGKPVRFLEITTEGNPLGLATALQAAGAEHLSPHPEQGSLNFSLRGGRLRIMAARSDASPGAGAGTRSGTIIEDLRRRGLTLNSIGLSLNPGSRGLPLDPTNGAADIEARLIRMNHSYVFLEDPIVMLRALRLRTRLEFALEERTEARMLTARESNYLDRATNAARGQELEAIAYEPDPAAVLRVLEKELWLEAAFGKGVRTAKMNLGGLSRLSGMIESWEQLGLTVDAGLVAMPLLLGGLAPGDQNRLSHLLPSRHLAAEWKKIPAEAYAFEKRILALGAGSGSGLRRIQDLIEKTAPEAVVWAALGPRDAKAGKKLKEFQTAAFQLRQRLPLGVLRGLGLAPHSLEAERILRPFYRRLLNGEAMSDAELAEGLRAATMTLRSVPTPPVATPPPPPVRSSKPVRDSDEAPRAGRGTATAGSRSRTPERLPLESPERVRAGGTAKDGPVAKVRGRAKAAPAIRKKSSSPPPKTKAKPKVKGAVKPNRKKK